MRRPSEQFFYIFIAHADTAMTFWNPHGLAVWGAMNVNISRHGVYVR